jgi:hypothetical protein
MGSLILGAAPQPCQGCTPPSFPPLRPSRSPLNWAPKACEASNPQAFMISPEPHPSGLHRPAWSLQGPCPESLLGRQPADMHNLHSARSAPFRHARPTLQRPASSPQGKALACRPMGPHPHATHHRRAPNLPKRYTQTSLNAKGVTAQLRLQFYCSRTGDVFLFFPLSVLLPGLLFDPPPYLPYFFSFPLYSIPFIFPSLSFLSFLILLILILLPS